MIGMFLVLFTLVFISNANIFNLRRLLGEDNVSDPVEDTFNALNILDIVNQGKPLCISSVQHPRLMRYYLGLERSLDRLICKNKWNTNDIRRDSSGDRIFSISTANNINGKNELFLSALPDRLSIQEELPEEFQIIFVSNKIYNIVSKYIDDEFNKWSLLCNDKYTLLYKDNTIANQDSLECQWQFGHLKPTPIHPTPQPTTTIYPTPQPTTTIYPTPQPTTTIYPTPHPTQHCYTKDNSPCNHISWDAYFPSCTRCCNYIQCDGHGGAFDKTCAPGTYWNPMVPNNKHSNGCVRNNDQCHDSGCSTYSN